MEGCDKKSTTAAMAGYFGDSFPSPAGNFAASMDLGPTVDSFSEMARIFQNDVNYSGNEYTHQNQPSYAPTHLDYYNLSNPMPASNDDFNKELDAFLRMGSTPGVFQSGDLADNGLDPRLMVADRPVHYVSPEYFQSPGFGHSGHAEQRAKPAQINTTRRGNATEVKHGQMTPGQSLSPANSDLSSPTADKQDANNGTKRKVSTQEDLEPQISDANPPEDVTVPTKPKRGRRSKKAKQITEEEKLAQRERFLERNRNAAAKCRTNKKRWQEDLKDNVKDLQSKHAQQQYEYAHLQNEYDKLKSWVMAHARHCDKADDLNRWIDHIANVSYPVGRSSSCFSNMSMNGGNVDVGEGDPDIARINADYTDKRSLEIAMPDQSMSGFERPRSTPATPSVLDMKHCHRRVQSVAYPSGMSMSGDSSAATLFNNTVDGVVIPTPQYPQFMAQQLAAGYFDQKPQ